MIEDRASGVKVINVGGRVTNERERLIGMTNEERAWRAHYLKCNILAPEEPAIPPTLYKELRNPIRRFYKAPMNAFENLLARVTPKVFAYGTRVLIAKTLIIFITVCSVHYQLKYNPRSWERPSGFVIRKGRPMSLPGDEDYPNIRMKRPNEYATHGFENSPI